MEETHWRKPAAIPSPLKTDHSSPPFQQGTDLTELLGGLIRMYCPQGMIIRYDPLPVVNGSAHLLQQAFGLLLEQIVKLAPPDCRHFLYFKYQEPLAGLVTGGQPAPQSAAIAVFTNLHKTDRNSEALCFCFEQARLLFDTCGMLLQHWPEAGDDCLFTLLIAGKPEP